MDLIFDFGNVLVRFDPLYMAQRYIPDTEDARAAAQVLFDRAYWDRLDSGELRDAQVREMACARLPERLRESGGQALMNWYRNLPDMPGMREVVRACSRRGDRLFLLSNISIDFAEKWREAENVRTLLEMFDGMAFSGVTGLLKPTEACFRALAEKYGIDLSSCLFVDDSPVNVEGARALGIDSYLFRGDADPLARRLGLGR